MLDYTYKFRDCPAHSIRGYFKELLSTLWMEGEGFSGKRPFGNSGWEYELYEALVDMGAVQGKFEYDEGERCGLDYVDKKAADKLVYELIAEMCGVAKGNK
jgi:hypothetical protein